MLSECPPLVRMEDFPERKVWSHKNSPAKAIGAKKAPKASSKIAAGVLQSGRNSWKPFKREESSM